MKSRLMAQDNKTMYACSACRRRKLKCDRNPTGCKTCVKSNIPCVYSTSHDGVNTVASKRDTRRKLRGPYKKGKTPREKELEHIVELLQQKCVDLELKVQSSNQSSPNCPTHQDFSPSSAADTSHQSLASTRSPNLQISGTAKHPSPSHILELWIIYTTSVDALTKIIHCPTFSQQILFAKDNLGSLDQSTEAIMFSIYYAAINTLNCSEVLDRFKTSKDQLMSLYQKALMDIVTRAREFSFAMLQALIIHMASLRRQSGSAAPAVNVFNMTVQKARQLDLDKIPLYDILPPFQAEFHRRAWWAICRHESANAEELKSRKTSIMHTSDVPLPSNVNDLDLYPEMTQPVVPRVGLTDCSMILMTFKVVRLAASLAAFVQLQTTERQVLSVTRTRTQELVENVRREIEQGILIHCEVSRPFDWLILLSAKIVMTKIEIILLESPSESDLEAYDSFHDVKVSLSLDVIECHQLYMADERLKAWRWTLQHIHQWFATVYVLEELSRRPDAAFANRAWTLLDLVFGDMDLLNKHGMQPETRTKLLEAHANALKAREELLSKEASSTTAMLPFGNMINDDPDVISTPELDLGTDALTRAEPWQFDQSLFDVEQAQLNLDALFWPSTDISSPRSKISLRSGVRIR